MAYEILVAPQRLRWRLVDGRQVDLGIADEIEIDTGWPLIPHHRGLIYGVGDGTPSQVTVIHNNKGPGVEVTRWNDFARGQEVRMLRRPTSTEHANVVWQRATAAIGYAYHPTATNCEHFTGYCYTGGSGESPTLQKWVLGAVAVLVFIAAAGE
jgi:hypothetical protein